ncbi:MAG: ATP synthase F1 subunit delta [Clostridia bacterium]|nr:ATP synthase F1 subunit delta [Clostridia bacterium]
MTDIGKEYGAALFLLAGEQSAEQAFLAGLETVRSAFDENPDYLPFLASPNVPLRERTAAITAAFGDAVPTHVLSFLLLLCEKGRIPYFEEAANEYKALWDASQRISVARIRAAVALSDDQKARLEAKLEAVYHRRIQAEYTVDPTVLGGLIVELDGQVLDGSLRHRLREMKDVMNG